MTSLVTNNAANQTLFYINQNTSSQNNLLAELSSGSRVVSAATDPASLAIGTLLKANEAALSQGATNAANGQSVLQTADGALSQISSVLQQALSLVTQSLSGSVDNTSRGDINTEFQKLLGEVSNITTSTLFNGTALIDGSYNQNYLVGTGAAASDTIAVDLSTVNTSLTSLAIPTATTKVDTQANATTALGLINTAIQTVATDRATVGAYQAQLQYSQSVVQSTNDNLTAAQSSITDADTSQTETDYNNVSVLTQAGIAALTKANQIPQEILKFLQNS
jgi:flagellin